MAAARHADPAARHSRARGASRHTAGRAGQQGQGRRQGQINLSRLARLLTAKKRAAAATSAVRYCPHAPTIKQKEFLELDCLEALYGGAAGGGKSDALLMAAMRYMHVPGYAAILFRRTYADLALEGALMDRSRKWLAGTEAHWNDREKRWRFPSGATLSFGYLDNIGDELRYQGAEFQFCGFDEVTQFPERQYTYLFSRLRRRNGVDVPLRMRSATNPGGPGHKWVKERFQPDRPDLRDKGRAFVPAKLEDNPHLDRVAYEEALSKLDSVTREQLRHGRWILDTSGRIYQLDEARNVVEALPELRPGEDWINVLGVDYGNVDATALSVLCFTRHSPITYVRKSQAWTKLTPSDAADIVKAWDERYRFEAMVADVGGLGKGYAEEARKRWALPLQAAAKTDKDGYIKLFNGELEGAKLRIVRKHNQELIAEMSELLRDTNGKEHPTMPNHLCDATLYGWRRSRNWLWEERIEPPKPGTQEHYDQLEADIDWEANE